jgi:hypothetical protein
MPPGWNFLLVHVFSALLPPVDPEDRDYYDVLGISRNAANEQVRKAYKVKSLSLHPDKVAQRGNINKEEAAAEYEKVQEAYGVLVNDEKRRSYHAFQCSPARYQFVSRGALMNPGALYENLIRASFLDKTRLVVLATLILILLWLQPVLIATKINQSLEERGALQDTKWVVILVPFWILSGLVILFWCAILGFVPASARSPVVLTILEYIAWVIGILFLSASWDDYVDLPYRQIFIPIYIAMAFRWLQSMLLLRKVKYDVTRMVTLKYLEREILQGKTLEELTENEREQVMKDFILISVPDNFEPEEPPAQLDPGEKHKDVEAQKVEASPEFEAATEIYNSTFGNLASSIIFGSIFLILLVRKLDEKNDASWWTVFTPIWVYLGSRLIYNTWQCLCGTISGEEIILEFHGRNPVADDENREAGQEDSAKEKKEESAKEKKDDSSKDKLIDLTSEPEPAEPLSDLAKDRKNPEGDVREENGGSDFVDPLSSIRNVHTDAQDEEMGNKADDASGDEKSESKKEEKEQEVKITVENNDTDTDKADKNDTPEDGIPLDEDTFHAFQSAYAQAEEDAMRKQAKAGTSCCFVCFEILILCLIVGKLEIAFDDDADNVGYNTFWILFPFLLIFGVLCCCCACLIYGAGASGELDEMVERATHQQDAPDEENPAPAMDAPPAEAPHRENQTGAGSSVVSPEPSATSGSNETNESNIELPETSSTKLSSNHASMDDLD